MRKCPGHAEDQFHAGKKKRSETTKSSASLSEAITSVVSRQKR